MIQRHPLRSPQHSVRSPRPPSLHLPPTLSHIHRNKPFHSIRHLDNISSADKFYIVTEYTDMRKLIDNLCPVYDQEFQMNPSKNALVLFCGRLKSPDRKFTEQIIKKLCLKRASVFRRLKTARRLSAYVRICILIFRKK